MIAVVTRRARRACPRHHARPVDLIGNHEYLDRIGAEPRVPCVIEVKFAGTVRET